MSTDETLNSIVEELNSEYSDYNLSEGLAILKDRVINAEVNAVVYPHPATQRTAVLGSDDKSGLGTTSVETEDGIWINDWTSRAACKGMDPDKLFVRG